MMAAVYKTHVLYTAYTTFNILVQAATVTQRALLL